MRTPCEFALSSNFFLIYQYPFSYGCQRALMMMQAQQQQQQQQAEGK
jgi:hypothetical protein